MQNESDNILDNLTVTNGKEEVEEVATGAEAPKKKTTKKATKKSIKKPKYSFEELKNKKPRHLEAICKELKIEVAGSKFETIQNILDKN